MSLSPLVRKKVTLVTGFVTDLVSPIVEAVRPVLDRFLTPIRDAVASFGYPAAFTGPSVPRTAGALMSAINDGTSLTDVTVARQIEESTKLLIGRSTAAGSAFAPWSTFAPGRRPGRAAGTFECGTTWS